MLRQQPLPRSEQAVQAGMGALRLHNEVGRLLARFRQAEAGIGLRLACLRLKQGGCCCCGLGVSHGVLQRGGQGRGRSGIGLKVPQPGQLAQPERRRVRRIFPHDLAVPAPQRAIGRHEQAAGRQVGLPRRTIFAGRQKEGV